MSTPTTCVFDLTPPRSLFFSMSSRIDRAAKRFGHRPSTFQSGSQRVSSDAIFFSPNSQRHASILERQNVITAPISILFLARRPAAIARGVIALLVRPSIDGVAIRNDAHVGEEVLERLPARAHLDAAGTIIRPIGIRRNCASTTHRFPTLVRARSTSTAFMAMRCAGRAGSATRAACANTRSQFAPNQSDEYYRATFASALDVEKPIALDHFRQSCPTHLIGPPRDLSGPGSFQLRGATFAPIVTENGGGRIVYA
jgi:hypothetical protein